MTDIIITKEQLLEEIAKIEKEESYQAKMNCGTCLFRKTIICGPDYDTIKLSCKNGYKLNLLLQPAKPDCWKEWDIKKVLSREDE